MYSDIVEILEDIPDKHVRDSSRIYPFVVELAEHWLKVPDWRFGELICYIINERDDDLFCIEDEVFLKLMDSYFNKECR